MADDADVQIPAEPETPVAVLPAEPVAGEAAPVVEAAPAPVAAPVAEAAPAKPVRKPRAAKAAAAKVAPTPPGPVAAKTKAPVARTVAKTKAPAAKPRKAAPRPAAKAVRPSSPAATPAPLAAAAPLAPRRIAKRSTVPTQPKLGARKIGQGTPTFALKDTFMATPFDLTQIQTAFSDIQGKAKAALEKGTGALGEANEFAKGNVEAVVESGKIFSAGLQDLGATLVAESRGAFDAMTADAKELAAAKSPTEFFQLQSALARKQFDGAIAQASKSTEAWLKLANDVFAPLSNRVTLAVEKVSKAA